MRQSWLVCGICARSPSEPALPGRGLKGHKQRQKRRTRVSVLHGQQRLVNQILFANLLERCQVCLPILRDAARVLSGDERLEGWLIHQQLCHALDFKICGVELMQGGSEFEAQFGRVEIVALGEQNIYTLTLLPAVDGGRRRESDGNEAHSRDRARV